MHTVCHSFHSPERITGASLMMLMLFKPLSGVTNFSSGMLLLSRKVSCPIVDQFDRCPASGHIVRSAADCLAYRLQPCVERKISHLIRLVDDLMEVSSDFASEDRASKNPI